MILDENLFDDVDFYANQIPAVETEVVTDTDIQPEGPEQGVETGIANLIHDLLIDENEAIQGYNEAAASMEGYPELQKIMHDIAGEEFAHIGELQKALEMISPNAANIEEGEAESEENLENIDEAYISYNDRFKQLPKEQQDIVIAKNKNRPTINWETSIEDLIYEQKHKAEIDAYNKRRYGFTW